MVRRNENVLEDLDPSFALFRYDGMQLELNPREEGRTKYQ